MTLAASTFPADYEGDNDFRFYSDERRKSWLPANVWTYGWVGKNNSNILQSDGARIEELLDASGNNRNWVKYLSKNPFRSELTETVFPVNGYTPPIVPLHEGHAGDTAGSMDFPQLVAEGPFYLAALLCNYRASTRFSWGDRVDYRVNYRQSENNLRFIVDGVQSSDLCPENSLPKDFPFFLEIWRDGSDVIRVAVNLVEVGSGVVIDETILIGGFGVTKNDDESQYTGASSWDDILMEAFVGTAEPVMVDRLQYYNLLRAKWKL